MDGVCFSFECTFNDDGSRNCSNTDTKYSKTTTPTPTTPPAPLPTHPKSHPTSIPNTSASEPPPGIPSTTPNPTVKSTSQTPPIRTSQRSSAVTTQKSSIATTLEPKPSPGKPSSTPISTWKTPSSHPSSQKHSNATTPIPPITSVTLHILTTSASVTTTANNSRLPDPPMPHKVTSYPPVDSADGKSIYIPCSVVGVVVFLFICIGIIRWRRIRRRSSSMDRQLLSSESERYLTFEDPQFQFSVQTSYVQPIAGHNDPIFSVDDSSDTENNDAEVDIADDIFNASNVRQKQQKHGGNHSGVV